MGKIWLIMLISGVSTLLFVNPGAVLAAITQGSLDAVNLAMRLVALYAFWLGFFSILEKTGVAGKLAKLLRPVVKFLFPGAAEETNKLVTMNISANLLGLGNAATPMAIRAVKSMDDGNPKASLNMIMLVVISSTSLQLLPSTVIGLRAAHGSTAPADFLFAGFIATTVSTVLGVTMVKAYGLILKKIKNGSRRKRTGRGPVAARCAAPAAKQKTGPDKR